MIPHEFYVFIKFADHFPMKKISVLFLLCLSLIVHANAADKQDSVLYVRRILIVGDSHLMGYFGESLQQTLHNNGHFDILSIAIGGAGSRNFIMTMRNNCCGYKIRESFFYETFEPKQRIRTLEWCNYLSGEIVGKIYRGQLSNVLLQFDPHIVIIALGHNFINDHQNLVNILLNYNKNLKIVWVGPFLNREISQQMYAINKLVQQNKLFLVRSDDIIGSDTASCAHYFGKAVDRWTAKVVERMVSVLHEPVAGVISFKDNTHSYTWDTLPFFIRYIDDKLLTMFQNQSPDALEILLPSTGLEAFSFSPRYLNRLYSHHYLEPEAITSITDADGNIYETMKAGNSFWIASNLKTSRYADGSPIDKPTPGNPHFMNEQAAVLLSHPNINPQYGNLYSWYAIAGNKKICPQGWHVPDISEIIYLYEFSETEAGELFSPTPWINSDGRTLDSNRYFFMWTINSVQDNTNSAWVSVYDTETQSSFFLNRNKKQGFPVRCVKD